MKDLLKKSLLVGIGALTVTRDKAETVVRDLEKKGDITSSEAREYINELVERGEQERNALKDLVRTEVDKIIKLTGLAAKSDLQALEERLDRMEAKFKTGVPAQADIEGFKAGFPSGE